MTPAPVPLAESLADVAAIHACPYRGQRAGCGCGDLRHCSAYGASRPWLANYAECLECVRTKRWNNVRRT